MPPTKTFLEETASACLHYLRPAHLRHVGSNPAISYMPYIQRSVPNGILFYFFRVCQRCAYPRMGLPCLISTLLSLALRTIIHAFHHSFFPFSTSSVSSLRDHSTWEVGPLSLPASMMHPSRTSSIRRGSGTITSGQPDVLSFTPLYY